MRELAPQLIKFHPEAEAFCWKFAASSEYATFVLDNITCTAIAESKLESTQSANKELSADK